MHPVITWVFTALITLGIFLSGSLIIYCLIRVLVSVVLPMEIENYLEWKTNRNKSNKIHNSQPVDHQESPNVGAYNLDFPHTPEGIELFDKMAEWIHKTILGPH